MILNHQEEKKNQNLNRDLYKKKLYISLFSSRFSEGLDLAAIEDLADIEEPAAEKHPVNQSRQIMEKIVNLERLKMTKFGKYFQAKIGWFIEYKQFLLVGT